MAGSRALSRTGDWISLLEATYSLDGDDGAWLTALFDSVVRQHWSEGISAAFTFDMTADRFDIGEVRVHGPPEIYDYVHASIRVASASAHGLDRTFRSGRAVSTASEDLFGTDDERIFHEANPGIADILGVIAHSGSGRGLILNRVLEAPRRSTLAERRRWTRCAAHMASGLRLRALAPGLETLDAAPIEAIFDGGGALRDARDGAAGKTARERLRAAVLRIDRSRTAKGRQDADAALEAWEALVHGRWSLVDRFDSDQRRFVVAVRNDPRFPDPRGLSPRERQVAEFAGLGRSAKEIAYLLGVPAASVENSLRRAQAKLGLGSRAELAAFFAPRGLRARLAQIALADETLLLGATASPDEAAAAPLTTAEREVLGLVVAGSTNHDIARRRASSPNTVANQVQSIFRKFGARSRGELVARIYGAHAARGVGN